MGGFPCRCPDRRCSTRKRTMPQRPCSPPRGGRPVYSVAEKGDRHATVPWSRWPQAAGGQGSTRRRWRSIPGCLSRRRTGIEPPRPRTSPPQAHDLGQGAVHGGLDRPGHRPTKISPAHSTTALARKWPWAQVEPSGRWSACRATPAATASRRRRCAGPYEVGILELQTGSRNRAPGRGERPCAPVTCRSMARRSSSAPRAGDRWRGR